MTVLCVGDCEASVLRRLLESHGLQLMLLAAQTAIPGSYWGEREAGLIGERLYARADTPIHSLLHEAAHFICMDPARRQSLNRDAGGDDAEECAVCYLQVLLADAVPECGRNRMWQDMDAWGYSFRLGSAQAWFEQDAEDARQWLERRGADCSLRRVEVNSRASSYPAEATRNSPGEHCKHQAAGPTV